jgi:RNA recognition motif-containing protein
METQQQSDDAIAELNGSFWHGRRVHMERQLSKGPRTAGDGGKGPLRKAINFPSEPTRFLYIGNIPYEATDAELNRMFRGLENMEDVRVAVDRVTGFPRGFAHADFTDVESAKKAHEKLSGYTMGDRSLRIDYAGSSVQSRKSKTFDKE